MPLSFGRVSGAAVEGGREGTAHVSLLRILSCSEMLLSTGVALEADAAEYSALEQYAHGVNFLTNPNASPTNQAMQSMCPRTADAFRPARICGPAAPAIKNKMMQQTAPQSEVRRTHLSRLSPSARGPREIGSPPHCRIGRGRGCAQEPAEALWRRSHPERHCQRIVYIMPPMQRGYAFRMQTLPSARPPPTSGAVILRLPFCLIPTQIIISPLRGHRLHGLRGRAPLRSPEGARGSARARRAAGMEGARPEAR